MLNDIDLWDAAQRHEHAYHCDGDITAARATSRMHRRWYASMLDIPSPCDAPHLPPTLTAPRIVAELGCGPVGMVLETSVAAKGSLAVDPLTFLPEDEARYAKAGMVRVTAPAETIAAAFEEAWVCNCLQHVQDPDAVMAVAVRATKAVRVFEWVDVPTDRLHLHTITEGRITGPLTQAGFTCIGETRGERAKRHPRHGDEWRQRFYAGVWIRRA